MHQAEDAADHGHRHVEGDVALGERIAVRIEREGPYGEAERDRRRDPVGDAQIAHDVGVAAHDMALPQPPEGRRPATVTSTAGTSMLSQSGASGTKVVATEIVLVIRMK